MGRRARLGGGAGLVLGIVLFCSWSPARCAGDLMPNPLFAGPPGDGSPPYAWRHGAPAVEGVRASTFTVGPAGSPPVRALGITGGEDRAGEWGTTLEGLEPGRSYRLFFRVYRATFVEDAYPEIELFGRRKRLGNLFSYGGWQDCTLVFTALAERTELKFVNNTPETFFFATPSLLAVAEPGAAAPAGRRCPPFEPDSFPLVAYGGTLPELPFVKDVGFTGVVMGAAGAEAARTLAEAAGRAGLRVVANARDDAGIRVLAASDALLGWYVEDEPEGRSIPAEEIRARVARIREAGSCAPTFMAMVRAEFARGYPGTADVLLMDQYPIPENSPVWLSRSMEEARRADAGEVWAVIQVFGGQRWQGKGWDRSPTFVEMRALSYLAIVHGARGLFFYTVKDGNYDVRLDPPHLEDLRRLLRELGALGPWFLGAAGEEPGFIPAGLHAFAPDGTMPVHVRALRFGGRRIVIAVNVLDKHVEGKITGLGEEVRLYREHFSGRKHVVKERNIVDVFEPYAVRVYVAEAGSAR
jgi:hypothetical protein